MAELADAPDLGSGVYTCRFDSCYPHQKSRIILIRLFYPNRRFGISSRFSVYLISPLGCISSLVRVYLPAVWWYTMLRIDDIQPLRVWWYTLSAKVIWFASLFAFSGQIQIVHFIPLSFNLRGIVQLLNCRRNALLLVRFYDIINSPINKNL